MAYSNYLSRELSSYEIAVEAFVDGFFLLLLAIRYEFYRTKRGREKEYDVFIHKEIGGDCNWRYRRKNR
jgi:hypothetical protein